MYTSRKRKFSASSEDVAEYPNSILDKKLQSEDPTSGPENDPFANYIGFDKIIQAGISDRISTPLFVGMLLAKRPDMGRYLYEFDCNGVMFDGFTTKNNKSESEETFNKLKVGFTYVLEGNLRSCERQPHYSLASNCDSNLVLNIFRGDITECLDTLQQFNRREKPTFSTLNTKIENGEKFTKEVDGVELISGSIQRYLGCNECGYALYNKDKHGDDFWCYMCQKRGKTGFDKRTREVCVNIWDLKLQDFKGTSLEGGVLHQHQCILLFGEEVIQNARDSLSDDVFVDQIREMKRTSFSCTIKHAQVTPDKGTFKLTIENLVKSPTFAEEDANDGSEQDFVSTLTEVTGAVSKTTLSGCYDIKSSSNRIYPISKTAEGFIGLAFIVNIRWKGMGKPRERFGSEKDVEKLEELFPSLGIKIFKGKAIQDIDFVDFTHELEEFKRELINKKYSSSFVIIMSHGELHTLQLANNDQINVYMDVVQHFGEKKFKKFCGNSKFFIFHGCQSYPSTVMTSSKRLDKTQKNPDCLICFPCDPGVKAKRNSMIGIYFIQKFVEVVQRLKDSKHLFKIMQTVQEEVSDIIMDGGTINMPNILPRIYGKFYFPPVE